MLRKPLGFTSSFLNFLKDITPNLEQQLANFVGQKQRLALARGLIRDTPILILDEPTSSLDPVSEVQIVELLKELSQSRILIVIAHRLTTISGADLIVFLKDGRLRELAHIMS